MSKFRSTILIIGLLIITVAAALLTVLVLYATGTIVTDPIELVYSVGSDSKKYDGTPLTLSDDAYKLVSGNILEGHTAQVRVIGTQTNAGESEATLEVKIFDEKGFDVSDGYAVKVNAGTLTVEKQNLSVVIADGQEVVYSGKEIFFNDYEVVEGTLAKGHKIAGSNASLMNVGKLPLDVQPVIYDAFDNDVTENYEIDFQAGEVEIVARPLTIKPKDVSKVYDGAELKATEYEIVSGSLAPGQTVEYSIVTTTGNEAVSVDCTEESGVRIMFGEFKILDEANNDVTANYDCYQDTAILKIGQRPITISTASQTFTYNGEAQFNDDIRILSGSLAPNQIISVTERATVTDVAEGEVENKPTVGFSLEDGTEINEKNYAVTWIRGTLSVTPLDITVYTKPFTKVYDSATTLGDYVEKCVDGGEELYTTNVRLPDVFTVDASYASIANKQDVESGTYALEITIYKDDEDCSGNFNITVSKAQYAITKKPVEITLANILNYYTYNGEKQADITAANALSSEGTGIKIADYGLTYADFKIIQPEDFINAGTYTYSAEVINEPSNYEITVKNGKAVIKKQPVTLSQTQTTLSTVYNGTDNYYDEQKLLKLLTVRNAKGETEASYEIGSADFEKTYQTGGSLTSSFQTVSVKRVLKVYNGPNDVTSNLEIESENISFKIQWTQRQLEMTFREYTWKSTPDDVDLTDYVSVSGNTPLAGGDVLYIQKVSSEYITSTSSSYRVTEYCIKNAAGQDVTHLYTRVSEDKCGYGYKT